MIRHTQIQRSFLQGTLKLYILSQARREPVYGGALTKSLSRLGYPISPGTLYPILHSLDRQGFLRSYSRVAQGRLRKYYALTEEGAECLDATRREVSGVARELFGEFEGLEDEPPELTGENRS